MVLSRNSLLTKGKALPSDQGSLEAHRERGLGRMGKTGSLPKEPSIFRKTLSRKLHFLETKMCGSENLVE